MLSLFDNENIHNMKLSLYKDLNLFCTTLINAFQELNKPWLISFDSIYQQNKIIFCRILIDWFCKVVARFVRHWSSCVIQYSRTKHILDMYVLHKSLSSLITYSSTFWLNKEGNVIPEEKVLLNKWVKQLI